MRACVRVRIRVQVWTKWQERTVLPSVLHEAELQRLAAKRAERHRPGRLARLRAALKQLALSRRMEARRGPGPPPPPPPPPRL